MDAETEGSSSCMRPLFRWFVCVSLTALLALQVYAYVWNPSDGLDGDFSDVKYVVLQLTRGLSEVNNKHEKLKTEMERISSVLPAVMSAAARSKEALEPAKQCCRNPLELHDYDRQITDYALESAGARIIDTGDTVDHFVYETPLTYLFHLTSSLLCRGCISARTILSPGSLPGECWAFKGQNGGATIRLIGTVRVTGVCLEHIPAHISPTKDIPSAPRVFQIEGLEFKGDPYPHDFGSFEYDRQGKPIQYFEVRHPSHKGYNLVRIKIHSNWGHPVYTCVYRVRVHGDLVEGALAHGDDGLRIDNE